jgi:hypothetical protein
MSDDALRATRNTLDELLLSESDLIGGDRIARRFAELRANIAAISDDEPWLKAWLEEECTAGGALFVTAKEDRGRNGSLDAPAADENSRASIIRRFNAWSQDVVAHIDAYRRSGRTESDLRAWPVSSTPSAHSVA